MREDSLVLAQSNGHNILRAMTSTSYGRIWDSQVVDAVEKVNHDGRWVIPAASYATTNPKRATTLYASDRDVFIFLVDPKNPIEINGEQLFRGFYTWNSEVGSAVFGLCTFLYRYVCDNRIIWGQTDVKELRIRHTGGAPERFAYEGQRVRGRMPTSQPRASCRASRPRRMPKSRSTRATGYGRGLVAEAGIHEVPGQGQRRDRQAEQGGVRSVWDVVNGITAYARSISHTDARVELETKAGKLMDLVSK